MERIEKYLYRNIKKNVTCGINWFSFCKLLSQFSMEIWIIQKEILFQLITFFLKMLWSFSSLSFQPFNHLGISNKKILILAKDIRIAVKKIIGIHQKLVLPSRTWTFFPFDEATESGVAIKATVPEITCINSTFCI